MPESKAGGNTGANKRPRRAKPDVAAYEAHIRRLQRRDGARAKEANRWARPLVKQIAALTKHIAALEGLTASAQDELAAEKRPAFADAVADAFEALDALAAAGRQAREALGMFFAGMDLDEGTVRGGRPVKAPALAAEIRIAEKALGGAASDQNIASLVGVDRPLVTQRRTNDKLHTLLVPWLKGKLQLKHGSAATEWRHGFIEAFKKKAGEMALDEVLSNPRSPDRYRGLLVDLLHELETRLGLRPAHRHRRRKDGRGVLT